MDYAEDAIKGYEPDVVYADLFSLPMIDAKKQPPITGWNVPGSHEALIGVKRVDGLRFYRCAVMMPEPGDSAADRQRWETAKMAAWSYCLRSGHKMQPAEVRARTSRNDPDEAFAS